MSFYEKVKDFNGFNFNNFFNSITEEKIEHILVKDRVNEEDFLSLLSPKAEKYLEEMAQIAHDISINNFGRAILLYTPMYLSNYCVNKCLYCGYNVENGIRRKKLALGEVEVEAKAIYEMGYRHILILTGESRKHSPISYIKDCVKILKKYFSSIAIEIYPLEEDEYRELICSGVDSLTLYQEVYDEDTYKSVHVAGAKSNYKYRLDAPERAAKAKIHSLSIGALLGLEDWRKEAFFTGLHGKYIEKNYPDIELTLSTPRIRPHAGSFEYVREVTDKNIVQAMLAYKIFIHRAGINITTRERAEFRDNLLPLGVTKMSASVSTEVGGHSNNEKGDKQFEIDDSRNLEDIKFAIKAKGYHHIFKDWEPI
ncbi:2-iminoacetate synthase ThiH [Clostridium sp. D2Q-11]|uniref:2-iminoacetate synthase ThiH n=1 Tax=Anaeromonas frigoriresistens TaxID=2683708 RepID=A0A942Z6L4_9FIRM|nr:2-iminoacetate synthase ThiH [Anaeromonas frigoriresistens]MBS4538596.1 2-iminoacetate synthase ThiH [Anaeromonas frigoriresistens]